MGTVGKGRREGDDGGGGEGGWVHEIWGLWGKGCGEGVTGEGRGCDQGVGNRCDFSCHQKEARSFVLTP